MTTEEIDWVAERAEGLAQRSADAQVLVGKTISAAEVLPHDYICDGENVLRLTFTDGSTIDVTGGYGGYSGESCDEYFEWIRVGALEAHTA